MALHLATRSFYRGSLPHWEVYGGSYFVTVRCADSLPAEAVQRLHAIHDELNRHAPNSTAFSKLQRDYFRVTESYLDRGIGQATLAQPRCAEAVVRAFAAAEQDGATVPHYVVMPNHWHAIIRARGEMEINLRTVMSRMKGRASKWIGEARGVTESLWQREWFDHWIREPAGWDRCVDYIHMNPVRAGLAAKWQDYPWVK